MKLNTRTLGLLLAFQAAFATAAEAAIDFTKAEGLATSLAASLGGTFATAFFVIGLIVAGFLAAFNRISWMWVGLIMIGAFLVFGGPAIVANLRATLG
jgi:type IV secretory pathway VirB2 component (pilin)